MKVVLIDYDINKRRRAFPNLALMKLSAYHKMRGDEVLPLNFPIGQADTTYASCVFPWHKPKIIDPRITIGGSGFGVIDELPGLIEHFKPDYTLYPGNDFSMGYTSRGCIHDCPFCKVRWKEGYIKAVASVYEFYEPSLPRIVLLDNNIFAAENCKETFTDLIKIGKEVAVMQNGAGGFIGVVYEDVPFKRFNPEAIQDIGQYIGEINVSYKILCAIFGRHDKYHDTYKQDASWHIEFQNGEKISIGNFKDGHNYLGRKGKNLVDIKRWDVWGTETGLKLLKKTISEYPPRPTDNGGDK